MSVTGPRVDALVAAVPIPTGMVRNDTKAQPYTYVAGTLYGFPLPEDYVPEGDGGLDRDNFVIALELAIASTDDSAQIASRASSTALEDAAEAITDWVRVNRQDHAHAPSLWDALKARVVWPGFRGFEYRGVRIELSGYSFVS